jgi:hypothetical protein
MLDRLTDSAFWIVANYIQQNCFTEADSFWDNQETPCLLWNPEGFVTCLQEPASFLYPVHNYPFCFSKIYSDVLPFVPKSFKWSLSVRFPYQNPLCISLLPCMCHIPCQYYHFLFAHPNTNNCSGVQIMKLLIMQYFPYFWCFLPLRPRYLPQHPLLKHCKPMLLL